MLLTTFAWKVDTTADPPGPRTSLLVRPHGWGGGLAGCEPDGNALDAERAAVAFADRPLTCATLSTNPEYRAKGAYTAGEAGEWEDSDATAACAWGWQFVWDATAVKRETHLHQCTASCFKYNKRAGTAEVCRHLFYHFVRVAVEPGADGGDRVLRTLVRKGKRLVPEVSVVEDSSRGRRGRIAPVRIHAFEGSSNPFAQVVVRCNLDVQLMNRVTTSDPDGEERVWRAATLAVLLECGEDARNARCAPSIDSVARKVAARVLAGAHVTGAAEEEQALAGRLARGERVGKQASNSTTRHLL